MTLEDLGWDERFASAFAATEVRAERGLSPARVVAQTGAYRVAAVGGERAASTPSAWPASTSAVGSAT